MADTVDSAISPPVISAVSQQRIDAALMATASATDESLLDTLASLFNSLSLRGRDVASARARWQYLLIQLSVSPEYCVALRECILRLLPGHRLVGLFSESGLLPNSGFFTELSRILAHKCLPEVKDAQDIRQSLQHIFRRCDDEVLQEVVSVGERNQFWRLLNMYGTDNVPALQNMMHQMLEASLVLSHRLSAMGLEPELMRVMPRLNALDVESPFIAMHAELLVVLAGIQRDLAGQSSDEDGAQLFVLLSQCDDVIQRARLSSARLGTSMALSFLLTRMSQHLDRLRLLLQVLTVRFHPEDPDALSACWADFLHDALQGERTRNSLSTHLSNLTSQLALRITDNAARAGEHYIANSRGEWFLILRQASGAGVLIAILALLKLAGAGLHLGAASQAWLNALIYSGGFAVIYMLHFIIATKQPAMTAATLAGSISQARGRLRDQELLVSMVVATLRSQLAAIAGNIMVALPLALLVGIALGHHSTGLPVSEEKALHLLADMHPLKSLVLFHAAIAGVWLFVTGLVSGYLDNRAVSMQLGARIAQLRWLRGLLGARAAAVGDYLESHAGGLGGNIFFGMMLGLTPLFGHWLGWPLDIRHVAFSAANIGYALVALDFTVPLRLLGSALMGLALVGLVNLSVSFILALSVAMRSRCVPMARLLPVLSLLWQRVRQQPGLVLQPPPRDAV